MTFEASTQEFHLFLLEAPDFHMEFEAFVEAEVPAYEGAYIVIPKITPQSLPTEEKKCTDDIQVLEIPYREVDNIQNGKTVIIGDQ